MVINQSMKRIHAARTGRVEEGQSGGSGEGEPVAVSSDIGDVIGNEPVGASQHLLLGASVVEANQAVGGGDVDCAGLRVRKNAVDTKYVLVFDVVRAACVGSKNIEAAIEIADPEAATRVRCERGNVAIAKRSRTCF